MGFEPVDLLHVRDHPFAKKPKKPGAKKPPPGCDVCDGAKDAMQHVGVPMSLNITGAKKQVFGYHRSKSLWQVRLTELLLCSGLPRNLDAVYAEGQMCFPDRRTRDQGNYRFMVEKALGDALVAGGWLVDDDWSHYEFGRLRYDYAPGEAWTALTLHPSPVMGLAD